MSGVGIIACGAYVPRLRLQRSAMASATSWFNPALARIGRGERSISNWDEDALTMSVEAARDCLGERDRDVVSRIVLASTSLPFADRQNAAIAKEALALPDGIGAMDITGSQRAGTSALLTAIEGAQSGNGPVLCIASDRRAARPASAAEFINGDAAAALLVGHENPIAEFIGSHSVTFDFIDHYRASNQEHDYEWESRWIRDEGYAKLIPAAISEALARFDLSGVEVDHFIMPLPVAGFERQIAKFVDIKPESLCDILHDRVGFSGVAHPLLMLTHALQTAKPDALIAVVAFGQGVDVLLFRTTEHITQPQSALGVEKWLERRQPESNYLKYLHFAGEVKLETGMRAELDLKIPPSMLYRDRKTIFALMGGRCRVTGTVQYPKTDVSIALNARMVGTQDDYPLADRRAEVVTFTADHLAFTPDPPSYNGIIDFEGGGRMLVDMVDLDGEELAVGAKVRMMFRLKRTDARGFKHYFWKAVPDYRQ